MATHIFWFPWKEDFLSLPIWIRMKTHFSLKVLSFTVLSLYSNHWLSYGCHELEKIGKCHQPKVWHLKISHEVNHLSESRIIMDLVLNLEELSHLPQSFTHAFTTVQVDVYLFWVTFCFVFFKKSVKSFYKFLDTPFWESFERTPACHTLSRAFEIFQKTLPTSSILWFIYFMCDRY